VRPPAGPLVQAPEAPKPLERLAVLLVNRKQKLMNDDLPSRAWAALPGLQGKPRTPWQAAAVSPPRSPMSDKPAVHACPYCAMPSVLSNCW
jgi:hypothetical protein